MYHFLMRVDRVISFKNKQICPINVTVNWTSPENDDNYKQKTKMTSTPLDKNY